MNKNITPAKAQASKTQVRGDYLPQLDQTLNVMLYRQRNGRPDDAVAVEDSHGRISWDNSGSCNCGEPAVLTVKQALHIISRSSFSPISFYVVEVDSNSIEKSLRPTQPQPDKATARPWTMAKRTKNLPIACLAPDEKCGVFAIEGTLRIATIHGYLNQEEHNAALIVKAVNEHAALREALEFYATGKDDNGAFAKKVLNLS